MDPNPVEVFKPSDRAKFSRSNAETLLPCIRNELLSVTFSEEYPLVGAVKSVDIAETSAQCCFMSFSSRHSKRNGCWQAYST